MEQVEEDDINGVDAAADDVENYNDWDSDGDVSDSPVRSLFCDILLPSVQAQLEYDKQTFGFDLKGIITDMNLHDDLLLIMLVNYIRTVVKNTTVADSTGQVDITALSDSIRNKTFMTDSDTYMKPVLDDDPLLYGLRDALGEGFDDDDEDSNLGAVSGDNTNTDSKERTIEQLRELYLRYKALYDALGNGDDQAFQAVVDIELLTVQDIVMKIDEYKLKLKDI